VRNKGHILFLLAAVVLLAAVCQGCGAESTVSRADLKMVNAYIAEQGAEEMNKKDAESMDKQVLQNKDSQEIKTAWALIVNFVENAESEEPVELGYAIVFDRASFSIADNDVWEHVGG